MKCLNDCHTYELLHHDQPHGEGHQYVERLQFVEKREIDGKFETVQSGTTNEEVIKCLIHRIGKLNAKASCRQNSLAITKLEEALHWLENRTAERQERGVENTPKA